MLDHETQFNHLANILPTSSFPNSKSVTLSVVLLRISARPRLQVRNTVVIYTSVCLCSPHSLTSSLIPVSSCWRCSRLFHPLHFYCPLIQTHLTVCQVGGHASLFMILHCVGGVTKSILSQQLEHQMRQL